MENNIKFEGEKTHFIPTNTFRLTLVDIKILSFQTIIKSTKFRT